MIIKTSMRKLIIDPLHLVSLCLSSLLAILVSAPGIAAGTQVQLSNADCESMRQQLRVFGWNIERTNSGGILLTPPSGMFTQREKQQQPLGFLELKSVLEANGWVVEREPDRSILLYFGSPSSAAPSAAAQEAIPSRNTLDGLRILLQRAGWSVTKEADGSLVLQPGAPVVLEPEPKTLPRTPTSSNSPRPEKKMLVAQQVGPKDRQQGSKPAEESAMTPTVVSEPIATVNLADADSDGVADDQDVCPGTPSGVSVNQLGCARAIPIVFKGVTFKFGSAELTERSQTILERQADILRKIPDLYVKIIGYTDSMGSTEVNQVVSELRAASVERYLISRGLDANALTSEGRGENEPTASNATRAGRAQNRRVELLPLGR